MRRFGFPDAVVTPSGADGGVDVRASRAVAQVKARSTGTPRPDVQQLQGIASAEGKLGVFFSLAGYTAGAIEWAESARVALFVLESTGTARPIGALAEELMNRAVSIAVEPDETLGAFLTEAEESGSISWHLLVHLVPGDEGIADGRALAELLAATIDKPLRVITADEVASGNLQARLLQRLVPGQVIYLDRVELFPTEPLQILLAVFCGRLVLRPSDETIADVVGQTDVITRLRIVTAGAKARGVNVPHFLLSGPPGCGKSTLAQPHRERARRRSRDHQRADAPTRARPDRRAVLPGRPRCPVH
jgi:hypothetical protein